MVKELSINGWDAVKQRVVRARLNHGCETTCFAIGMSGVCGHFGNHRELLATPRGRLVSTGLVVCVAAKLYVQRTLRQSQALEAILAI